MERKDVPPPYNSGFSDHGHAQPSAYSAPHPVNVQPPSMTSTSTTVVVGGGGGAVGGCPVCHNGGWTGTYSCCAWLWCLCCFPCGIICCLCMRKKKCSKCGFTMG